jgi:ubiquinone/menaquinone biosynthesis C-methylase UbiE
MTALLQRIGRLVRGGLGRLAGAAPPSSDYEILTAEQAAAPGDGDGWHAPSVAAWQDRAYRDLLAEMHAGRPRNDLQVAADAVRHTGLADPAVLEVGCGSGYYSEVLGHLLGHPIRYTGLDYSPAMIDLARTRYPAQAFVVGDAAALPFADGTFDVVINGAALMHMLRYREAVAESRRVSRGWCVLHTVPVLARRPTTYLRKRAYGQPTVEVIFNEEELRGLFRANGLVVRREFDSVPYDLAPVLGEPTASRTYLCQLAPYGTASR